MKIKGLQDVDELRRRAGIPEQPPRMISAKTFVEQQCEGGSCIENEFAVRWMCAFPDLPYLCEREFDRVTHRAYRFDFCFPNEPDREPLKATGGIAVELNGAIWKGGQGAHSSGKGLTRDYEKNLCAAVNGWQIISLTPEMARDRVVLERIAKLIRERRG